MHRKKKQKNDGLPALCCSACGKKLKDMQVLTEVDLEAYSWYINKKKNKLENINGLWKKKAEYFCEPCFTRLAKVLEKFYIDCHKV